MADLLTLRADPAAVPEPEAPPPYSVRRARRGDIEEIGGLYFVAYDPGVAWPTPGEAVDDIRASFDGAYGELLTSASPVAVRGGALVAAVLTVHRAPWPDTPDYPFIIELFTAREHRRRGLARALVSTAAREVARRGETGIALRVDPDNEAALGLYGSLGFRRWEPS